MEREEREFWKAAYLAALAYGRGREGASTAADAAVEELRKRTSAPTYREASQ